MAKLRNYCKERLAKGELALGANPHLTRSPEIGRVYQACGYDWLFIDLEHSAHSVDSAGDLSLAALDQEITPLVRVGTINGPFINRVICNGAMGVIAAHVDTPEEAAEVVKHVKFAPDGEASVPAYFPQFRHADIGKDEAGRLMNETTLVVPMIESEIAVNNADAIAAIPGVDVLFIGGSDLTFDMGINGQYAHSRVKEAARTVVEATKKHGNHAGFGGPAFSDVGLWTEIIQMGYHFISCGSDLGFITAGARQRSTFLRGLQP